MIANGKHFLLNNQEDNRWFGSNDADIRTIMEIYLPPWEGAVEAGIGSIMCSCEPRHHVSTADKVLCSDCASLRDRQQDQRHVQLRQPADAAPNPEGHA